MSARAWLPIVVAALGLAGLTACGDDADGGGATAAAVGERASQEAAEEGGCAGTALDFENLVTGVQGTAGTALATHDGRHAQYTAHVADFAITEEEIPSWRPEVPEGQNVITIQVTVFVDEDSPPPVPLEVGQTLQGGELLLDTHTFLVRHFDVDQDWSGVVMEDGVGGEMTVTSGGDLLCFEVDYQDAEKRVSGTVEAPVFRVGF